MVRIRFRRMGLKGQPSYRIVVTDKRSPRDGRFIEIIGFHNPRTEPATDTIKEERALHWLNVGAQPSEAVMLLMKRTGTWARFERLRKGESMETLVAEAQAQYAQIEVSPKTRYPAPADGQSKWKAAERAAAASAAAEAEAAAKDTGDAVDALEADAKKVAKTVEGEAADAE
ncbi:MAG: 30S ribosomal protein S16 [Anaerolineae bacterium]|nr:30S ribosomal protein S16 [Anaerolineae bacterium]